MTTTVQVLHAFMQAAEACALELIDNAAYIGNEIPKLDMTDERRIAIEDICEAMFGTKHDVISELGELDELFEPASSPTVQGRVDRIVQWLVDDLKQMHVIVKSLEAEDGAGSLYMLLAGAGVNILNAFGPVREAADAYRASAQA